MENLLEEFNSSFRVSLADTDTSLIHPRYCQYKQKLTKGSQEKRRAILLEEQKKRRLSNLNAHRGIVEEPPVPRKPRKQKRRPPLGDRFD